jgi:hypothetical protein
MRWRAHGHWSSSRYELALSQWIADTMFAAPPQCCAATLLEDTHPPGPLHAARVIGDVSPVSRIGKYPATTSGLEESALFNDLRIHTHLAADLVKSILADPYALGAKPAAQRLDHRSRVLVTVVQVVTVAMLSV